MNHSTNVAAELEQTAEDTFCEVSDESLKQPRAATSWPKPLLWTNGHDRWMLSHADPGGCTKPAQRTAAKLLTRDQARRIGPRLCWHADRSV